MKAKHKNDRDLNYFTKHTNLGELDRLALELDALTRVCLRNGVLGGILGGYEDDIRQDAILLVLSWATRGEQDGNENNLTGTEKCKKPWALSQVVAKALRICKMRMARRLTRDAQGRETLNEINGGLCQHYSDFSPWNWPVPIKREMALRGLRVAVKSGKLSHSNACVAGLILEGCMSVDEVAKNLKISLGAIYQQLRRVKRILPSVIEGMEPPNL